MSRFSKIAISRVKIDIDEYGLVEAGTAIDAIDDMDTDWQNEFDEMERDLKNQISDLENDIKDLNKSLDDKDREISDLEYELRHCK